MYVCMYVRMYVCMYVCLYVCVCVCTCAFERFSLYSSVRRTGYGLDSHVSACPLNAQLIAKIRAPPLPVRCCRSDEWREKNNNEKNNRAGRKSFGYIYIYIHTCVKTRTHTSCAPRLEGLSPHSASPPNIHTCRQVDGYIHPSIHSSIHTYIHTSIHTYIHTYIHS